MATPDLDVAVLYGLAPERFVPERNALARELRKAGRREEADAVAALRKPSAAAHAVNTLVRSQPDAVARLWEAGDALGAAQTDVLAGRAGASALTAAAERERAAVEAVMKTSGALSPQVRERVVETLHAAAFDAGAREPVAAARLERELRHVGLGGVLGAETEAAAGAPSPARDEQPDRERERERAAQRREADKAVAAARRTAERAERALHAAEQKRHRASEALDAAEEALRDARAEADAAAQDRDRAERALDEL
jgi:hypothetical protein